MALNLHKELKLFYSIEEVAQQFGVTVSLLRYWEQEFPMLKPRRAGRNIRQYTKEDIETIRTVYNLVKVRGIKIAKAREILKKDKAGEQNMTDIIEKLQNIREELINLRSSINKLDPDLFPDAKKE